MASLEEDDKAYAKLYRNLWGELDKIEQKLSKLDVDARNAVFKDKRMLPAQVLCLAFESETEIMKLYQLVDELAGTPGLPFGLAEKLMYHVGRLYAIHNNLKQVVQSGNQSYPFGSQASDMDKGEDH